MKTNLRGFMNNLIIMRITLEQITSKMRENSSLRIRSQFGTEQIATSEKTPGKSKY